MNSETVKHENSEQFMFKLFIKSLISTQFSRYLVKIKSSESLLLTGISNTWLMLPQVSLSYRISTPNNDLPPFVAEMHHNFSNSVIAFNERK